MIRYKYTVGEVSSTLECETMEQLIQFLKSGCVEACKTKKVAGSFGTTHNNYEVMGVKQSPCNLNRLMLSVKAHQILKDNGLTTIDQIIKSGEGGLRELSGMGAVRLEEVKNSVFSTYGVRLK